MKMTLQGMEIELTPQEFIEMQELLYGVGSMKKPHEMTLQEECELLGKLRHFIITDTYWDNDGEVHITLVRDKK